MKRISIASLKKSATRLTFSEPFAVTAYGKVIAVVTPKSSVLGVGKPVVRRTTMPYKASQQVETTQSTLGETSHNEDSVGLPVDTCQRCHSRPATQTVALPHLGIQKLCAQCYGLVTHT